MKTAKFTSTGSKEGFPEYFKHSGQVVTIVRQLTLAECDEECQPMYEIKADDGWVGSAFDDELIEAS